MKTIQKMGSRYRFSVLEVPVTDTGGYETIKRLVVVKNKDGLITAFTGLEYFSAPYTGRRPYTRERGKEELYYVCHALNYIFMDQQRRYRIQRLSEVTAEMIFEAFDSYRVMPKTPEAEQYRGQQSLDRYVYSVSAFFANASSLCTGCAVSAEELFCDKSVPDKYSKTGRKQTIKLPAYDARSRSDEVSSLMRDVPDKVMDMLIEVAEIYDPMLVFAIVASKTCGLRLGELMNMRQPDSPLSGTPGIRFGYLGSAVSSIEIDLTREYRMRSDGMNCGKIKKERRVVVYKPFIREFMRGYDYHMKLLARTPYEPEYKPMFVSKNGKAMTAKTFSARFSKLVDEQLKLRLLSSEDPTLVAYGMELEELSLTPHALRHYFSVRLVLENLDTAQIMFYRGDRSPASALTYLANKGALIRKLNETHTAAINMLRFEKEQ